jgi:hypothetical protein
MLGALAAHGELSSFGKHSSCPIRRRKFEVGLERLDKLGDLRGRQLDEDVQVVGVVRPAVGALANEPPTQYWMPRASSRAVTTTSS